MTLDLQRTTATGLPDAATVGRLVLELIAPYVRPAHDAAQLGLTAVLPGGDGSLLVGIHDGGQPASRLTIGDRDHDSGIPLALLERIAAAGAS